MSSHVHALNTSPAKLKYSFGKATRFQPYKANTDVSYLPIIQKQRRSAIIGYGQRSLVDNKFQKQYPHSYNLPSTIEANHGNSFKAGRNEIGGPLELLKYNKSIPGPGNYQIRSSLQNNGVSLRPRLADFSLKLIKDIPGPGAYVVPSSLSNGQKNPFQSKFSVGGGPKIPPKGAHSVQLRTPLYEKKSVPGPGQYDIQKYGVHNPQSLAFKKQGTVKFGRQLRQSLQDKNAKNKPGPGQYKIYSQFDD